MPRASRYLLDGYTYHLTHRCHDRRFLLKFREEREEYREWLRTAINRHGVSVYAYCITSNHVHVVAHAHDRDAIAEMMHLPSSAVARHLNRRKKGKMVGVRLRESETPMGIVVSVSAD